MKNIKARYWACVAYPESLPSDWLERLRETGLQVAISPLHDKDLNADETEKKPHFHLIFAYEGPTTYNNVKSLCDTFNMTIPIKLESIRGMYRYHIHIDNPEKYQYDDRDRILLNGFDSNSVNELTKTEVNKLKKEIIAFINDNDILEYADLITVLLESDCTQLLDVATSHTLLFNTYITSKRHSFDRKNDKSLTSDNINKGVTSKNEG